MHSNTRARVAVVGAGYFSQFHYNAWRRLHEAGRVELAAVCDRDGERARAVAASHGIAHHFTDLQALLAEVRPDVVDLVTPPDTHEALVTAAIGHDALVICQKPFTPSLAAAERLTAAIAARGATVVVHENFRFQPWYAEIRRRLDARALGQVYQYTFRRRPGDGQGPDAYLARQPYFQQMPRFLVHETAIHLIDVFRYLGGEVQNVYAQLDRLNPAIAGEDAGLIVLGLAGGARAVFDGNRLVDHPARNRRLTMGELLIEGERGCLRLDGDGRLFHREHGSDTETAVEFDWQDTDFGGDCVFRLIEHVVAHLAQGTPLVNTAAEYLANLRVEEAVYRSAASGRRLDL